LTAAAINGAAQEADEAAGDIRRQANVTVANMQARAAQFTGAAGTAFRNVLNQFTADLDKFILQKLEELAANTRIASNQMFDQDEQGAAAVTRAGTTSVTGGLT
jgi:uncharacterized protein YukE